jgi:hypothetical protein
LAIITADGEATCIPVTSRNASGRLCFYLPQGARIAPGQHDWPEEQSWVYREDGSYVRLTDPEYIQAPP